MERVETEEPDETQIAVTVVAEVEKVERSKSGLKAGATIQIHYTRHERKQFIPGASEVPILVKGKTYPAFLTRDKNGKDYVPAAVGHSFERVN